MAHIDDLRHRHVDFAAVQEKLRVDERDPDDAAVPVVPYRVPFRRAVRLGRRLRLSDGEVKEDRPCSTAPTTGARGASPPGPADRVRHAELHRN